MSSYHSGGGRSSGRSGGRGRGRHGGGGRGRGGGGGVPHEGDGARLRPCGSFTTTGACPKGNNCSFAHVVKLHASIDASSLKPQNQQLMKFFGVSAIPTQILLDKTGVEYFRHSGYISFDDLNKQFTPVLN